MEQTQVIQGTSFLKQKVEDYKLLVKLRLTLFVVFSSAMGFLLATGGSFLLTDLALLCLGGFLVTGAANALNQVFEKDFDKLMPRTANRPLPAGRMKATEALLAAGLMSVTGVLILATFNPLTALIGALSLLSYAFVYTPMKRVSSIAVLIGAFPGAFPPMIGWVAATGFIGGEALILFGIQFMWQFPHFWAIAWVAFDDYASGGFHLLPSKGGRDKASALQCVIYAALLIPVSLFTYIMGVTGIVSAVIVGAAGFVFLGLAVNLYLKCDKRAALLLMFGSFFYLPIALIALVVDKI